MLHTPDGATGTLAPKPANEHLPFLTLFVAGIALLISLTHPSSAAGQTDDIRVVHLDPWEIPIQSQVGLVHCSHGFIWIAGYETLWRYDGYTFVMVTPDSSGDALPRAWIQKGLAGGRHGVLGIYGSSDEFVLYDIARNHVAVVALPRPVTGRSAVNRISCAFEDSKGRFLIGTETDGVYALDATSHQLKRLFPRPGDLQGRDQMLVRDIEEDSSGGLWIGTSRGVWWFPDGDSGALGAQSDGDAELFLPAFDVAGMTLGHDGRVWLMSREGQFGWIAQGTGQFVQCAPLFRLPRAIEYGSELFCADRGGDVWSMAGGVVRWNLRRGRWESVLSSERDSSGARRGATTFVTRDRSGNIWVGTGGAGLYRFTPQGRKFSSCTPQSETPAGLSSANVLSLWKDQEGILWVGTVSDGLDFLQPGSRRFQHVRFRRPNPAHPLSGMVTCIRDRGRDELWVGGVVGRGITVLKKGSGGFFQPCESRDQLRNLGSDTVTAMHRDRAGTMWVGHYAGLDRYDEEEGSFRPVIRWERQSLGVRGSIGYITEDDRGNLWLAAVDRGLGRLRIETGEVVWYRHDPEDPRSLPARTVWCAYFDSIRGTLWVPGNGWEIACHDPESDEFVSYRLGPTISGTPSHSLQEERDHSEVSPTGITGDSSGNLWICVWGNIIRFNPDDGTFSSYGREDGIAVADARRNAIQRTDDGTIYLGGSGGLTWFHPELLELNAVVPQVAVTRFTVFGRPVPVSPFGVSNIRLRHDENTVSFEFAALEFTDPQKNQFMYTLEGSGTGWEYLGTYRRVTFAHMTPGKYVLRVRASNNDGLWNTEGLALTLTISPPFWETTWFRGLGLALVAGSITVFVRYRRAKRRGIDQLRIRIANDLHDDIGSELSAIALESDLIARRMQSVPEQQRRIQGVGRAVREAAEKLRDVVWIVNPEQEKLGDLMARMREIAPVMLGGMKVSCSIPQVLPSVPLAMTVKRNILLMYKEILSNICRHAEANQVRIQIEATDGVLELSVRDNGVGFDPSGVVQGRGLKSIRARAHHLGGTLSIDSAPGAGTSVRFRGRITHLKD